MPGSYTCPTCGGELYISKVTGGGGWYQCLGTCGFNGDSVAILAARAGVSMEDFLRKRRMADTQIYTEENITKHRDSTKKYAKYIDAWRKFSERHSYYTSDSPEVVELLAHFGMSPHIRSAQWANGHGTLFGVATTKQLKELDIDVPGPKSHAWLMNPIYGAPGFLIGLAGIDVNQGVFYTYFDSELDGMAFMRKPLFGDTAFAFGSARHVFHLQVAAQNTHTAQTLPLVCYTSESTEAWNHLHVSEVVLWDAQDSLDLFVMARRIGDRARVSFHPHINKNDMNLLPAHHFNHNQPRAALEEIKHASRPWLEALKDYILARAQTGEINRLPEKIALSSLEIEKIQSYCRNAEERKLFSTVYTGGPIEVTVTLGSGRKVVQRVDGWYRPLKKDTALLTNAMPIIEELVTTPQGNLYKGYIRVGNTDPTRQTSIPFRIPAKKFTVDWLKDTCIGHHHFAQVSSALGPELYDIATRMHTPKVVAGLDKLGWNDDVKAFVFPSMTIQLGGEIVPSAGALTHPHAADDMEDSALPDADIYNGWFNSSPGMWRLFLAGLYGYVAPALKLPQVNFAVRAGASQGNEALLDPVARMLCATHVRLEELGADPDTLGLPLFVNTDSPARAAQWLKKGKLLPPTVITLCDDAARLAELCGWSVLDRPVVDEVMPAGMGRVLVPVLKYLQTHGYSPSTVNHPVQVMADLVRRWARFTFESMCPVLKTAEKGCAPALSEGDRIYALMNDLVRSQALGYTQGIMPITNTLPSANQVVRDKDVVSLPYSGLRKAALKSNFPLPTSEEIGYHLKATDCFLSEVMIMGSIEGWRLKSDALNR